MINIVKSKQIKLKLGERDILALSFAVLTLCFLILGTASYLSARSCSRLAKGGNATLVQQLDGTAFIANSKPPNYRDPLVVRRYVGSWVAHTFALSGELDISEKQKIADQGIVVEGRRIPTNVLSGAYAWAANKRQEFIQAYMEEGLVSKDYFNHSSTTQEVEIDELGQAQLIDEEKQIFSVNVVATISKHQDGQPTGKVQFYRRKIIVASIPIPLQKPAANASIYQQLSYQWRKEGLQIQEINPLSFNKKAKR